ncbi:MAG: peptidylglycine alpha-amidating monooxygenase [Labilithrix sp.]|nr:peptidylglycine alpha-amidating monooxygenase [Labilithrix sp.]
MTPIRRPLGLAAAAICAVTLAFACTAPVNSLTGDDDIASKGKKGGDAEGEDGAKNKVQSGLPCKVADVLAASCQTCHGAEPKAGASTPLVTFEDLHAEYGGKKLFELVKDRIHAEQGRMPPAARLSDAEVKAIDDWVAGGAAKSTEACDAGEGPPPATRPFVCPAPAKVTVMKASKAFAWTNGGENDRYVCFGVDELVDKKRHVIALGPQIENLDIVHHVLLFQSDKTEPNEPKPCSAIASGGWKMVTGWAPGGGNLELPPEAGFPEEKGTTHWVLQVHYNNARNLPNQTDNSGYQICSTDQLRPNDAGVLAFGSKDFTIPPRTASHTIKCDYKLGSKYAGVKFFGASPHMHTRGIAISTERIPGGNGAPQMIFEQKPFSFENQENFKLDHKEVAPGDVMRTRCTWKNPDDRSIKWGENTDDEMCFNFFTYYPAIPDVTAGPLPVQTWITPSLQVPLVGAKCTVE